MNKAQAETLAKRFGLEAIPESVKRLNKLITSRDACIENFAELLSQDANLAAQVLKMANPRAGSEQDYVITTLEEALQRTGMSSAILLAMTEPLVRAVYKSFLIMLSLEMRPVPLQKTSPFEGQHVVCEVSFSGKANGLVDLRLPPEALVIIGQRMLGLTAEDVSEESVANDLIGELGNMIAGNFRSNLSDAGLPCKLSTPVTTRSSDFSLPVIEGGTSQRFAFKTTGFHMFADLSVNTWTMG